MEDESSINQQIKEQIIAQLCWDNCVLNSEVDVAVDNGLVTLTGRVPSIRMRNQAEKDARAIPGVRSVDNQLIIEPSMRPDDEEIRTAVKNMLEWAADIDASRISVSSEDGIVTLEGSVNAYWEKIMAEDIANDFTGVREVRNRLSVTTREKAADSDIAEDIQAAIERSYAISNESVAVDVNQGHVTLSGIVPTWDMYLEAEEIARHTQGVKEVANHLSVE